MLPEAYVMPAKPTGSPVQVPKHTATGVLPQLTQHATDHQLDSLASRLEALQAWLSGDLQAVEQSLLTSNGAHLAQRAGFHILKSGGKRLRPLCTLIAGRVGPKSSDPQVRAHVRDLAVAVELVHAATLLHDDVVDLQDKRRGALTSRVLHGNEVSIFAGDWLLVEALRRIVSAGVPELVTDALSTIEAMIFAEVEQVERAKTLASDKDGYFRVIDGKTAALFRWALRAGAMASGCDARTTEALVAYGTDIGIAFQLVDDVLDLDGEEDKIGKGLFSDLAEGKITLPLGLLLERRPELRGLITDLRQRCNEADWRQDPATRAMCALVLEAVRASGALQDARAVAELRVQRAKKALDALPADLAEVQALRQIADVLAVRQS
jgi:octaprenyl-diphosphate synthase